MERTIPRWLSVWPGLAIALAVAAWALSSAWYFDHSGYPTADLVLPLAFACGMALAGGAVGTPFRSAAGWFGLLLVGQAASLRLVNAGTALHYQHLTSWRDVWATDAVATGLLVVQFLAVLLGFASRVRAVVNWCRRSLGWRAVLFAAAFVLSSATVSEDAGFYVQELALATIVQALALGNLVLAAAALPPAAIRTLSGGLDRLLGEAGD